MKYRLGFGALALVGAIVGQGCKGRQAQPADRQAPGSAAATPGSGSAAAGSAGEGSAVAVLLASRPAELTCGPKPLRVPAATPAAGAAERALPRAVAITACRDLPSAEAVCACLVASPDPWIQGTGMSAPVTCAPSPHGNATARLVQLTGAPADPDIVRPGTAFALVAARGATWSAVAIVEHAPDIDLTETPKASHGASIARFETRPHGDATLVWIESDNQYSETAMMEQEVNGTAAVTICVLPRAAPPTCYAPIKRAEWDYTFAIAKAGQDDACEVRSAAAWSVQLDAAGVSVRLDRGADLTAAAGRYRL